MPIRTATGYQAPSDPMACEVCGKLVAQSTLHSIKVMYAVTGGNNSAFQCIDEQHWGCSEEHAALAAFQCYFNHIRDLGNWTGKGTEVYTDATYGALYTAIRNNALSF